jgi:hypothetical protein
MQTECISCDKHLYIIDQNRRVCLNVKCKMYGKTIAMYKDDLDEDEDYYPDDFED